MGKNKMKMNVRNKLLEGLLLYNRSDMTVHQQRKIATYLKESRYTINTLLTEDHHTLKDRLRKKIEDLENKKNDNNNDNGGGGRGTTPKPKPVRERGFYIQTKLAEIAGQGKNARKWLEKLENGEYVCRAIPNTDTYKDLWIPYTDHQTARASLQEPDTAEGQPINGLQMYNAAIRCININNLDDRFMLFAFRRLGDKWPDSEKIVFLKHEIKINNPLYIPRKSDGTFDLNSIVINFNKQKESVSITSTGYQLIPSLNGYFTGKIPEDLGVALKDNESREFEPAYQPSPEAFSWSRLPKKRKIIGRLYAASQGGGTWENEYISAIKEIKSFELLKQVSEYMQFIADQNVKHYFDIVAGMDADKFADQYFNGLWRDEWRNWIKSLDSANLGTWGNSSVDALKNGIYFAAGLHKEYMYKSDTIYIASKDWKQSPLCTQILGEFDRDDDGYKTIYNFFKSQANKFKLKLLTNGAGLINTDINFALPKPL